MGSWIGDRDAVERSIHIIFRFVGLIGALVLMMALDKLFGWKPSFVTFVICGGIMGALGFLGAKGVIALIFSRGGKRKKSTSSKETSKPTKRRKRKAIESFDDE